MEKTEAYIAGGTVTSRSAEKALLAVEGESLHISTLMENIAKVTEQHSQISKHAKKKMLIMQDLTLKSFERVNETTELINSLTATANQLQESIYRFKLPSHVFYEGEEKILSGHSEKKDPEEAYEY